jgi:L-asparagine transporter-like permease
MFVRLQVSQIGQFEAEMSSDSFQLLGMAERGFLPACLARRSRYETPTLAIVLSSVGICALSMFDFRQVSSCLPQRMSCVSPLTICQLLLRWRCLMICLLSWGFAAWPSL